MLESQVDRKDDEIRAKNIRLRELEEVNELYEASVRDNEGLRRQVSELQSATQAQ